MAFDIHHSKCQGGIQNPDPNVVFGNGCIFGCVGCTETLYIKSG